MKVYLYQSIDEGLTDAWHDGGGLVIVTDRDPQLVANEHLPRGHEWLPDFSGFRYFKLEDLEAPALPAPDLVLEADDAGEERIFIFPDSGCC